MPDGVRQWDEAERLACLSGYGILDSPSVAEFDDFVRIAAEVCDAPIAVVNLIDARRQWFAAEIGLGVRETPLDISICARAILQSELFVVPDLTLDHRFDCNPLVTGAPHLRFYGGALLQSPEGLPLGTMCVLDYVARPEGLTERQAFTLQALARQVMAQLELRRVVAEKELLVQEAHHRVKNSLQMVQSLLERQAKTTQHPEAAQQLRDSAARVHTFGAMHEHLYRAGSASHVDLAEYLGRIVSAQEGLTSTLSDRATAFAAERVPWPAADAPPIGLMMLELVTNALKYGAGRVTVTLRHVGDEAVLTVEDEGNALPPGFDPADSRGLGMRVLTGLLRGQRGRLEVDRSRGHTCFHVVLRVRAPG